MPIHSDDWERDNPFGAKLLSKTPKWFQRLMDTPLRDLFRRGG